MKFKIFVCTALVIIILLLGTIAGALIYGGMKASKAATSAKDSITSQFNDFTNKTNSNVDKVNQNLSKISQELKSSPYSTNTIP